MPVLVRIERAELDRLDKIVAGNDLSRQETMRRMISRGINAAEADRKRRTNR